MLVARGGKLVAKFAHANKSWVGDLRAIDLTGDGIPELTYNVQLVGGSDGWTDFYAYQWRDAAFTNIIGSKTGTLGHWLEGGVTQLRAPAGKPSKLVLYDFIWEGGESHADPHRYWAEWYELKDDKFVRVARQETKRKYGAKSPLSEFGIVGSSATATSLKVTGL